MKAEVEVLQPGLFSTIQDGGRLGYREYGVPVSGAMDSAEAALANQLLQNEPDDALLEVTLQGPQLRFSHRTAICITGALLNPVLDETNLNNNRIYEVYPGQVLAFGRREAGYRAYLAVKGGFMGERFLNSYSWSPGITPNERLVKGMVLNYNSSVVKFSGSHAAVKQHQHISSDEIEAYPGPEYDRLSTLEKETLQKADFTIGKDSNRMGIRFQEKIENSLEEILTSPVLPGTVQLTPSGMVIVLMRDAQTTGGYPRILQLSEKSINILAQKLPGEKVYIKVLNM